MVFTMLNPAHLRGGDIEPPEPPPSSMESEPAIARLVTFLAAGFRAPSIHGEGGA